MLEGRDGGCLQQLFRYNLQEIYESILLNDRGGDNHTIKNCYTTITEATEASGDNHIVEFDYKQLLFMFNFSKFINVGGINSPYICMEWP